MHSQGNSPKQLHKETKMEPNLNQETIAMGASSMQVEDSVKSRILERIKAQMDNDSTPGTGFPIPPIYLKAPDDWP
jgi:hypothetical protein